MKLYAATESRQSFSNGKWKHKIFKKNKKQFPKAAGGRESESQSLHSSPCLPLPTSVPAFGSQQTLWLSGKLTWPLASQTGGRPERPGLPSPTCSWPLTLKERSSYYQATVVYAQLFRLPFPAYTRHPTPVYYFCRPTNYSPVCSQNFRREPQ